MPGYPSCRKAGRFNALGLETGDLALAAMPEGAVVERKTPSDLIACMTSAWERFERELARSRYLGRFVVVVEGGLPDVLAARRQMSEASVIGSLAAWQRRYTGFFFAGNIRIAAEFSFSFLAGQVAEIERVYQKIKA
jgi:ERCC4-type nuclease